MIQKSFFLCIIFIALSILVPWRAWAADLGPDSDNDGLSDALETQLGTNPNDADSDHDGHPDGQEVANGYNPLGGSDDRSLARRAEVNLSTQTLQYFLNNVLVGSMPVSSGVPRLATPTGEFSVQRKVPVIRYTGVDYDFPGTKWNLQFKPHYYLHGAYWHKQFGVRPMSHGCVNISYQDVEKLYAFLQVGDAVRIYGKTPVAALKIAAAKN